MSVDSLGTVLCRVDRIPDQCCVCNGKLKNKCMADGYCNLLHLTQKQLDYVESDINRSIYLNACPGSGKTEVIAVKYSYETQKWMRPCSGIAVLTFTNSAENEIRDRINSFSPKGIEYPHFVGTFTSWLHGYIANPFLSIVALHGANGNNDTRLRIVEDNAKSDFLNSFKTRYSYGKILNNIPANHYCWDIKARKYVYTPKIPRSGKNEFDSHLSGTNYMKKDLCETKKRFWKSGFFTYEDVEILSYLLLKRHVEITRIIAKRFPLIIVDECQDLSLSQLKILSLLREQGTKIHLVGDLDQAIYEFRKIDIEDTKAFIISNELTEMKLNENFRSNQSIVNASIKIIQGNNNIEGKRDQITEKPLLVFLYRNNQEEDLVQLYHSILEKEGIEANNCRIIVRNNAGKDKLLGRKAGDSSDNIIEDYAHFVFLTEDETLDGFQERIKILARAIQQSYFPKSVHGNSNNLYKPEEIDTSTWINIIILIQKTIVEDECVLDLSQNWEIWKKALRKCLDGVSSSYLGKADLKRLKNGIKNDMVVESFSLKNKNKTKIQIETIHGCKGMSLDSVLFISSYSCGDNRSGAYWKDWFIGRENNIDEAQRLAYVAFSRAKHLLALGIPNPVSAPITEMERKMLMDYGFEIIDEIKAQSIS